MKKNKEKTNAIGNLAQMRTKNLKVDITSNKTHPCQL